MGRRIGILVATVCSAAAGSGCEAHRSISLDTVKKLPDEIGKNAGWEGSVFGAGSKVSGQITSRADVRKEKSRKGGPARRGDGGGALSWKSAPDGS